MKTLKSALYCLLVAVVMFFVMWGLAWAFGKLINPSYMYTPYLPTSNLFFTM